MNPNWPSSFFASTGKVSTLLLPRSALGIHASVPWLPNLTIIIKHLRVLEPSKANVAGNIPFMSLHQIYLTRQQRRHSRIMDSTGRKRVANGIAD